MALIWLESKNLISNGQSLNFNRKNVQLRSAFETEILLFEISLAKIDFIQQVFLQAFDSPAKMPESGIEESIQSFAKKR